MKTNLNGLRLATAALLALVACKGLAPMEAKAQLTPTSINVATNIPTTITTASSSNITSYIPVRQGKNLTVTWRFALSGAATDNNSLYLYPRPDGTNIWTLHPFIITTAGNGTTQVIDGTNLPAAAIQGFTDLAIGLGTNGTARSLFLTNITYTYGN